MGAGDDDFVVGGDSEVEWLLEVVLNGMSVVAGGDVVMGFEVVISVDKLVDVFVIVVVWLVGGDELSEREVPGGIVDDSIVVDLSAI